MARLSKTLVTERETAATEAFKAGKSVKEVNDMLFAKNGRRMSPKRLGELKKAARQDPVAEETPVVEAETVDVG